MTEEHPITPPQALIHLWVTEADSRIAPYYEHIATKAARWGADQELEACRSWVSEGCGTYSAIELIQVRRPKPPSLKKQALTELNLTADPEGAELSRTQIELIRRALESLPD